jgi:hypothetical protein
MSRLEQTEAALALAAQTIADKGSDTSARTSFFASAVVKFDALTGADLLLTWQQAIEASSA